MMANGETATEAAHPARTPGGGGRLTRRERLRLFWFYARRRAIVLRAVKVALVITPLLTAINHYHEIAAGRLGVHFWLQMALTFTVPYCVSTYSSAMTALADHLHPQGGGSAQTGGSGGPGS